MATIPKEGDVLPTDKTCDRCGGIIYSEYKYIGFGKFNWTNPERHETSDCIRQSRLSIKGIQTDIRGLEDRVSKLEASRRY